MGTRVFGSVLAASSRDEDAPQHHPRKNYDGLHDSDTNSACSPSSPFNTTARRIRPHDRSARRSPSQTSFSWSGQVVRLLVGLFAALSSSSWSSGCGPAGLARSLLVGPVAALLCLGGGVRVSAEPLTVYSIVRPLGGAAAKEAQQETFLSGSYVNANLVHGRGPGSVDLSNIFATISLDGIRGNPDSPNVTITLTLELVLFRLLPTHPCYGIDDRRNYNDRGVRCDEWSVPGLGIQNADRRIYCCSTTDATDDAADDPAVACPDSNNSRGRPQLLFDNAMTSVTGRRFATLQGRRGTEIPIPLHWWGAVDYDDDTVEDDPSVLSFVESGTYTVVVASCGSSFEALRMSGNIRVTNSHGSAPAHLWPVVRLHGAVFVLYGALLVLYGLGLYRNERTWRTTTPVEYGIFLAMLLATLEAGVMWSGTRVWNATGEQSDDVSLAIGLLGVLVRTWLRGFVVALSHGWTVTCPTLGRSLTACVVVASFAYVALSGAAAVVRYLAIKTLRAEPSADVSFATQKALRSVVAALDVVFAVWVVVATTCTLRYLNAVQQLAKLRRYRALRWMASLYILTSMALVLTRQAILMRYNPYTPQFFAVGLLGQVMPLLFVASLAVLWRPQRSSWQYTYAPQVPPDDPSLMELTPLAVEALEPPVRRRRRSDPPSGTLGNSGEPVEAGSEY